jgi:signal transduction histidine kinase
VTRALLRSLRKARVPAPVADIGATEALLRVAGYSVRQGALGIALAAALAGLAWRQQAWQWLGLYCMRLAPLATVGAAAQGLRLLPRLGWPALWAIVLALIAASAMLGVEFNRSLAAQHAVRGLRDAPALACAAGFGMLVLALPLWQLQTQAAAARLATLEQAALSAELKALQAQIEPHFLYNTLANTRYLVRHDAGKAGMMLDHLIAYLHSALPDMRGSGSTLGREFELAGHYLALMAIRFGERLSYRLDCAPGLEQIAMPPLMLMSLVENAVRHGVEATPGPVCVTLAAAVTNGALQVSVTDDGAGAATPVLGSGVGLRNLRARLAAQYGDAATFTLRIAAGKPTQAQLILPLEPS